MFLNSVDPLIKFKSRAVLDMETKIICSIIAYLVPK